MRIIVGAAAGWLLGSGLAGAQLWQTPKNTSANPLLQGFKAQGTVFTRGDTTITLDTAGGVVVGVLVQSGSVAGVARGLGLAWNYQDADLAGLQAQLGQDAVQRRAQAGFQELADQDGTLLIFLKRTGTANAARWTGYTALNIWPDSAFPATKNVSGKASAPGVLRIFNDFQCPYCQGLWQDVLPGWEGKPGDYRVIHYHFPLDFHKNALAAAEASECAAAQGKFWPYADALFAKMKDWSSLSASAAAANFGAQARALGLNTTAFSACLGKRSTKNTVQQQLQAGMRLSVGGTPTVFLNGYKLGNYADLAELGRVQKVTTAKPSAASVIANRLKGLR